MEAAYCAKIDAAACANRAPMLTPSPGDVLSASAFPPPRPAAASSSSEARRFDRVSQPKRQMEQLAATEQGSLPSAAQNKAKRRGPRPWTPDEDKALIQAMTDAPEDYVKAANAVCERSNIQCRDRWTNYLDPNLDKSPWRPAEEDAVLLLGLAELQTQWAKARAHT